jgi:hypothetical protein
LIFTAAESQRIQGMLESMSESKLMELKQRTEKGHQCEDHFLDLINAELAKRGVKTHTLALG